MDNLEATNGTVLFGAVDYSKYDYLETQPIDAHLGSQLEFGLTCNRVQFENYQTNVNKTVTKNAIPVSMSYNYPQSEFPVSILKQLVGYLGGTYNSSSSSQEVSCDFLNDTDHFISFKFGLERDKIELPVADVVEQQDDKCMLKINKSEEKYPLITFGMDILRYLYMVYDMERFEISIGIRKFNDSPANISVITKKTAKGPLDDQVNRAALSMASSGYSGATFAFILPILISLLFW
ncbi:uncharacterized protein SPAPADRAFT_61920 [Spathaspora passalidarum NRRL Y-27907]|uniref:Peptidase A1 domain-containing protein n=1 Tax=Spathaspora passalidarum (strain NRRL Y-27907 / 11-Y1) TaxID=619300 RepID=G3ART6_SPAPN|nr:uncharacterized protein SPAPADRAFT_61920 [Spathaspora passalidarum NRRL Y-27907]EGW31353.1 hypothetical protein SPAPADRAFT_61920 [Spathaspora passalidarum NRRL Y-27907]